MEKDKRKLFTEKFTRDSIFVQTTDDDLTPFDINRIVAVLLNETGLEYKLAVKISEEIEKIILTSNLEVVTSEFVRELVNTKLIEYKLEKAREKNKRLGLSLFDVGNLLKFPLISSPNSIHSPLETTKIISENVKRQFVLNELYENKHIAKHIKGDFHIQGISCPDKVIEIYFNLYQLKNFSYTFGNLIIAKPRNIDEYFNNIQKIHFHLQDFVMDKITYFNFESIFDFYETDEIEKSKLIKNLLKNISNSHSSYNNIAIELTDKNLLIEIVEFVEQNRLFNIEIITSTQMYINSPVLSFKEKLSEDSIFFGEVVTVNLPRLALKNVEEKKNFDWELKQTFEEIFSILLKKQIYIQRLIAVRPFGTLNFLTKLGMNFNNLKFGIALNGLNEWGRIILCSNIDINNTTSYCLELLEKIKSIINQISEKKKFTVLLTSSAQENICHKFARLDLKFYSYTVSKIVNGRISDLSIYYTRDCSLPSNIAVPFEKKVEIESKFQSYYDFPFKTVIKTITNKINNIEEIKKSKFLSLTYDFSICYHCILVSEGMYKTCPNCFGTNLETFAYSYNGFYPVGRVNKAFMEEIESYFYYN